MKNKITIPFLFIVCVSVVSILLVSAQTISYASELQKQIPITHFTSKIFDDDSMKRNDGIWILKTSIWLYDSTWREVPIKGGGNKVEKAGRFLGTIKKGTRAKVLRHRSIKGTYRPSRDVIIKNYHTDFLLLEVLNGPNKNMKGWFRNGSEKLLRFSTNPKDR